MKTQKRKKTIKKLPRNLSKEKDQYSLLAEFRKIKWHSANGKLKEQKFPKGKWSLLWNPSTKELIGINNKLLNKIDLSKVTNLFNIPAMKIFIAFQDHKNKKDYDFSTNFSSSLKEPIDWELLGKGKEVEYYSDKFNKGDFYIYYHEFGEFDQSMPIIEDHGVMIYYDRKNGLIKIAGGKLDVNERGIIN